MAVRRPRAQLSPRFSPARALHFLLLLFHLICLVPCLASPPPSAPLPRSLAALSPLELLQRLHLPPTPVFDACRAALDALFPPQADSPRALTLTGLRVLDAWGRPPSDVLGTPISLQMWGDYGECSRLDAEAQAASDGTGIATVTAAQPVLGERATTSPMVMQADSGHVANVTKRSAYGNTTSATAPTTTTTTANTTTTTTKTTTTTTTTLAPTHVRLHYCLGQGFQHLVLNATGFLAADLTQVAAFGMCLPLACRGEAVQALLANLTETVLPGVFVKTDARCAAPAPITTPAAVSISVVSFFLMLVVAGTLLDVILHCRSARAAAQTGSHLYTHGNGKRTDSTCTDGYGSEGESKTQRGRRPACRQPGVSPPPSSSSRANILAALTSHDSGLDDTAGMRNDDDEDGDDLRPLLSAHVINEPMAYTTVTSPSAAAATTALAPLASPALVSAAGQLPARNAPLYAATVLAPLAPSPSEAHPPLRGLLLPLEDTAGGNHPAAARRLYRTLDTAGRYGSSSSGHNTTGSAAGTGFNPNPNPNPNGANPHLGGGDSSGATSPAALSRASSAVDLPYAARLSMSSSIAATEPSLATQSAPPRAETPSSQTESGTLPSPLSRRRPRTTNSRQPRMVRALLAFSAWSNASLLFSRRRRRGSVALFDGMRAISMLWVILGHTWLWIFKQWPSNMETFIALGDRTSMQAVINAQYAVDTFFYISGFLVLHSCFGLLDRRKRFPFLRYYLHRYFRITPTYAFVMLIFVNLSPFFGDGPIFFNQQSDLSQATCEGLTRSSCGCSRYWWASFLYIQNFYPDGDPANECMGWTWYLANDMQMYWLAPVILLVLYRGHKRGLAVWSAFFATTVAVPFALAMVYGLSANPIPGITGGHSHSTYDTIGHGDGNHGDGVATSHNVDVPRTDYHDTFALILNKPYGRMGPYLLGMLVAYAYRRGRWERDGLRLAPALQLLGWVLCCGLLLLILYGVTGTSGRLLASDRDGSQLGDAAWLALCRPLWGLALAWITTACLGGFGGLVTKVLSTPLWLPISRLTFCAYLIHPLVLNTVFYNLRNPIYYQDLLGVYLYIGNVVLSYAAAAAVALLVETPFAQLEAVFTR